MLRRTHGRGTGGDRESTGQSLAEFAIILPLFILLLGGALDLGRLFYAHVSIENAAKEGAFHGARNPRCNVEKDGCPSQQTVQWHVVQEAAGLPAVTDRSFCIDDDGGVVDVDSCEDGDFYQVRVTSTFSMVTPILVPLLGSDLELESTATAEVMSDAFDPDATPIPIPTPTPSPSPSPTPSPSGAPTPGPSAATCAVPDFIGTKKNGADELWADAGFTGALSTLPGNGNYTIGVQSLAAGASKPCDSPIAVGP